MRAAIYARYSSDLQRDSSIEDQVRICRDRLDHEGWTLSATYTDHAKSGASSLRPGYQKLLEDARRGEFEVLISEALDRLSRDQEDIAGLYKHLSFAGVKILTLAEGEINELHIGLKGTMNALFLKDLAAKIRRGQRGRAIAGFNPGGISYGFRVVREFDDKGEVVRGRRRIDENEAEVVRRIFEEYAELGRSPRAIAKHLNAESIPSPRGAGWNPSTISGHRQRRNGILWNEAYVGRLVYNRVRMVRDPITGKRISRPNPPEEWVVVEVPDLRIVSDDLWQKAQAIKRSRGDFPLHVHRRPKRLLSGLVRCGLCGGPYVMRDSVKLGCRNHREKGLCGNARRLSYQGLEDRVLDGLRHRLLAPDLLAEFVAEYRDQAAALRRAAVKRAGNAARELKQTAQRIERIIDAIEDGGDTPGMRSRLIALEERRATLEGEMATADTLPVIDLHPNLPELYRRTVDNLKSVLETDTIRDESRALVVQLVDRIVVTPANDGTLKFELFGMLAPVLTQAHENGWAAPDDRVLTVVAEEGLEPPTHGL